MKLRKTRIKKIVTANGVETFIPQVNTFLGLEWTDFTDYPSFGVGSWSSFIYILMSEYKLGYRQACKSLKEAQDVIDAYIAYVNRQNAISVENKIIKTEYVDYP